MQHASSTLGLALVLLAVASGACGDDGAPAIDGGSLDAAARDAGPPRDWPFAEVPASAVLEPGVRRDVVRVATPAPPPEPTTGVETPPELHAVQLLRYRRDVEPPAPARAILLAMPGFLGGGASFDPLARALVRRGAASGESVEVWAVDRRSNLLEDLRGMDAAEAAGDPEIANGYYFRRETVGGEAFGGFVTQARVPYMSEWGLASLASDVRALLALVPQAERRARVFLMGHSLGAAFTEAYASWRFEDGLRGVEELAGLVLVDGALPATAATEVEYLEGSGTGLLARPGLRAIRGGAPFTELPLLGVGVYARSELLALRVLAAPGEVASDPGRDQLLSILLELGARDVPPMTHRAAFGFAFDDASNPLVFAQVSLGQGTGGPIEPYESSLFAVPLRHPTDPSATYDWIDALEAAPPEHTPLADLAHAFVDGRTNFAEWYFPARLALDIAAVGGVEVPEGDYREEHGLRAFDRGQVDAPVLAIATALIGSGGYDVLPARLAPAIGAGRPHAGAARTDPMGLTVVEATFLSHIDPLTASDLPSNPVPGAIEAFVAAHAEAGVVSIPAL